MSSNGRAPSHPDSRMLPTDAFFWYAAEATPELRPLVAGLFLLDRAPDRKRLHASVQQLLAHLPRLRQRVVAAPLGVGLPQWADDPHFDLHYHLREVALPSPDRRHLLDLVSTAFETPLDRIRPLWEGYIIEGLEGGRAAYFLKVHHSVMDGIGAVSLFDAFTQPKRDTPVSAPRRRASQRRVSPSAALADTVGTAFRGALAGVDGMFRSAVHALQHPADAVDNLMRTAQGVYGLARDVVATNHTDPLSRRCTGIGRRVEFVSFSAPRLRRLTGRLAVSLNDVILTMVTGAVGHYHAHHGLTVRELQCMVPMNLRQAHERDLPGNRVGVFRVTLPIGERDPLFRLAMIREQTSVAKRHRNGGSAYPLLMQAVTLVPAAAFRMLAQLANGRVALICSNVPGPAVTRYLAGAKIEAVYPFAPVLLGIPLSIALVSYGDTYCVGIDADPGAIPDPELLPRYLEEALEELERELKGYATRGKDSVSLRDSPSDLVFSS